jgi:hypothetical protein
MQRTHLGARLLALAAALWLAAAPALAEEPLSYLGPITRDDGTVVNGKITVTPDAPLPVTCPDGTCGGGGGGTSSLSPFAPDSGSNRVDLSVTSSTAATALPATAGGTLEITNQASCVVYLKFGTSGVTAATSDSPIWPG